MKAEQSVHDLFKTEQTITAGAGGGDGRASAVELKHVLGGLALPQSEPWRRRARTILYASLSLLLHGSAMAAMLIMIGPPTDLGAISMPSQAISVEIVSSSVLESMQQKENDAEAAEAATDSTAGA